MALHARRRSPARRLVQFLVPLGALALVAPIALASSSGAPALSLVLHPAHLVASGIRAAGRGGGTEAAGWESTNWSGYAETTAAPYTSISGDWTVPTVSTPRSSYSAAWAGIDGFTDDTLIQTGTEQDVNARGTSSYGAWWTTSAQGFEEQSITKGCSTSGATGCGTVRPGDAMAATIARQGATTTWTITLSDTTEGWSFSKSLTYTGAAASAEWIIEAPTVGARIGTLADYASVADPTVFDDGSVNGVASPALNSSEAGAMVLETTTGSARHRTTTDEVISAPSSPNPAADGFAMAYGAQAPPPPSS